MAGTGRTYDVISASFAPGGAKTVMEVYAGSLRGFRVKRMWISTNDTGGTTVIRVAVKRGTATGTGSSTTPAPKKSGDLAFTGTAKFNDTVEPTKTTLLWEEQFNLLTGWILPLPPGEEFECLATSANGIHIELLDAPGNTIEVGMTIEED